MEHQAAPSLRYRKSPAAYLGEPKDANSTSDAGKERPASPKHRDHHPLQPKQLRPVSPPLQSTRLSTLIYILALLSALLIFFYAYRVFQYKSQAGGWLNMVLGKGLASAQRHVPTGLGADIANGPKRSPQVPSSETVESRIHALAEALGIPSKDLASAIAVAVREYVPPASLSSISARETGEIIDALVRGQAESIDPDKVRNTLGKENPTGVMEGVVNGMGSFVGMEEPM